VVLWSPLDFLISNVQYTKYILRQYLSCCHNRLVFNIIDSDHVSYRDGWSTLTNKTENPIDWIQSLTYQSRTPLTGGHLSPIVTISLCIAGLTPPLQALCYLLAQMTGATLAGILLAVSLGSRATEIENYGCYFNPTPEFNALHVFIFEFMGAICVIAMMYGEIFKICSSCGFPLTDTACRLEHILRTPGSNLFATDQPILEQCGSRVGRTSTFSNFHSQTDLMVLESDLRRLFVFAASDFAPPKSYGGTNGFPTRCWASSIAIFKFESSKHLLELHWAKKWETNTSTHWSRLDFLATRSVDTRPSSISYLFFSLILIQRKFPIPITSTFSAMSAAALHGLAYRFLKPCVEESAISGPPELSNNLISNANLTSFPPSDVIIQMGNPESSQVKEKSWATSSKFDTLHYNDTTFWGRCFHIK
jgi:hypothetical protein